MQHASKGIHNEKTPPVETAHCPVHRRLRHEQIIVDHIEAALLPNWVGTDQRRYFEFDGMNRTLTGPLLPGGVQGAVSLEWERLP